MDIIKCDKCNLDFTPSNEQQIQIQEAAYNKIERLILKCPNCGRIVFVFPLLLLGIKKDIPIEIEDKRLFCCPTLSCIGFVEEDKEAKVFGCSECGSEWDKIEKVYVDIEKIIKQYPYRKEVYLKKNGIWKSIDLEKIPKKYYDKVQMESELNGANL